MNDICVILFETTGSSYKKRIYRKLCSAPLFFDLFTSVQNKICCFTVGSEWKQSHGIYHEIKIQVRNNQ